MTWQGVCVKCGEPVQGHTVGGTLDVPTSRQVVVCLRCVAFGCDEAEAQPPQVAFEARRDVRS